MEMHERIKILRKNHLNLSQEAFGARLGVSRSVINNIERNCLARPEQKLSLIKLMCKEFGVNEEWLHTGEGEMFAKQATFSLDEFVRERGGSELEFEFLKAYFELDKDVRHQFVNHFVAHFTNLNKTTAAEPDPKDVSTEAEEAAYRKALGIAENTGSSALSTTEGTGSKASNQ